MIFQLHAALKNGIYVLRSIEIVSFDSDGVKCKKTIGTMVSDTDRTASYLPFAAGQAGS